ncbi:hypothetical protein [Streptomyces niveus]
MAQGDRTSVRYQYDSSSRTPSRWSPAPTTYALSRRSDYERRYRELIERGVAEGVFDVRSARNASYSIMDMGIGVASWFNEGGEFSVGQLAYQYGDMALRMVNAG